jgi:spermidine/putrescine transport system substrate-binding protein
MVDPRDEGRRRPVRRPVTRRNFMQLAGIGAAGTSFLAACARQSPGSSGGATPTQTLQIASPDHPVTWPIAADNAPIASGLKPEQGATLNVYNYTDYLDPAAMKSFQARYKASGVKVKLTTFNDIPEALAKIRSGDVPFDVFIGSSYDTIGKMVLAGLVRPLNHSYIPNIKNVWPEFTNPFYDGGWRYTIPYTIYTTGIAWRTDMVKEDIAKLPNPWDVFWDPQFQGKISVLDDYRETPSMVLLREGNPDVNTGDDAALAKVQADLLAMTKATKPKITINHYSELPEGKYAVSHSWSGDAVNMPYYLPKGVDPGILRYWFPADGKGLVNNDLVLVLRNGKNPVLSHLFLNHLLDTDVSLGNFGATGYQPPQVSLTPSELVDQEYVPSNLSSAVVLPKLFTTGYRSLELSPAVDAKWAAVWQRFKAGA